MLRNLRIAAVDRRPGREAGREQAIDELRGRTYVLHQWVEADNYWPAGAWQACAGEASFEDGEPIVVGPTSAASGPTRRWSG